MLTVTPNGQVISQVLGDSTISVESVANNTAPANSEISLNNVNGKFELNNIDVTNLKEDLVDVQARGNTNELKIGTNGNMFTIEENGITANTNFPITIDPIKNELTLSTNSGSRILSVLPFEAVSLMTKGKFMDTVKNNEISLAEDGSGELQYSISGVKNINILNLAKLSGNVNSTVSATSCDIIKVDESEWLKLLGVIL